MRAETITRAQAALPATLTELAERLGLSENGARYTIKHLKQGGYAQEWGRVLTDKGTLVPVIHSTGKTP